LLPILSTWIHQWLTQAPPLPKFFWCGVPCDICLCHQDQLAIHQHTRGPIWTWGAPTKHISDQAQVEISNQVKEILHAYCIADWQSESHYQHQKFAEHKIQQLKTLVNTIMDCVGAPPHAWFLCLQYVTIFLLNSTYSSQLQSTPSLL